MHLTAFIYSPGLGSLVAQRLLWLEGKFQAVATVKAELPQEENANDDRVSARCQVLHSTLRSLLSIPARSSSCSRRIDCYNELFGQARWRRPRLQLDLSSAAWNQSLASQKSFVHLVQGKTRNYSPCKVSWYFVDRWLVAQTFEEAFERHCPWGCRRVEAHF